MTAISDLHSLTFREIEKLPTYIDYLQLITTFVAIDGNDVEIEKVKRFDGYFILYPHFPSEVLFDDVDNMFNRIVINNEVYTDHAIKPIWIFAQLKLK